MTAVLSQIWRGIDRRIVIVIAVALLAALLVNVFRSPTETKSVSAYFPRAVSVFEGTDVRILGVTVGRVTAVIPEGEAVRVEMEYDAEHKLPADAKAVIVTPTLVADRFVQLTPVYEGGRVLADDAEIELPDTAVPVELDRIYGSLQQLTVALGPNGVNKDGSLDNLLASTRNALDGQGARGNEMLRELSAAAETFGEGAGPPFEAVTHLAEFTGTLAKSDKVVRAFMADLAGVSDVLADESDELQQAVAAVADAVGSVKDFVGDNRGALVAGIRKLTTVASTIMSEAENLHKTLAIAPMAMDTLHLGFDHQTGTQNSRVGIGGNLWSADSLLCGFVQQHPAMPQQLKDVTCELLRQLLGQALDQLPWLPPEYGSYIPEFPGVGTKSTRTGTVPEFRDTSRGIQIERPPPVTYVTPDDPSLADLMGGGA